MRTVEIRIPLPITVDKYKVGQNWCFNEQSKLETGGGEGVQILTNEQFSNESFLNGKYTTGQYTYKIYKIESKVSPIVRLVLLDECNHEYEKTLHFQGIGQTHRRQAWSRTARGSMECLSLLQNSHHKPWIHEG